MDFEEALVEELSSIEGLNDKVFPLNATEGTNPPFVIYVSSEGEQDQTLSGYASTKALTCEIHIVTETYSELKAITKLIISKLQTFFARPIGTNGPVIKSFSMDEPLEAHEEEFGYSRCSFDIRVRI